MDRLKNKIALITGGTSGIGLATAKLFKSEGAQVIITGLDRDRLAKAQDELGADTLVIQSDAGNLNEIDAMLTIVKTRFERLDVLFLNAGVQRVLAFEDVTEAYFDEIVNTNFKGQFFTIQKALPLISNNASIVATTSIAHHKAAPNSPVYAASKAAFRSMVRSLGVMLMPRGIRVNAVSPGPIQTRGAAEMGLPPSFFQAVQSKSPIKRSGTPDEVANAVLFLASDESSYICGTEITVDGGISIV